jgi:hypothetical protein
MADTEHSDFTLAAIKVGLLWLIGIVAHNYHVIAGNILVTLSICYLVWKWIRDYRKEKVK